MKDRALAVAIALALPASAMATTPPARACAQGKRDVFKLLQGQFDTRRQFDRAVPKLKVAPSVGGVWLDRQHAEMTEIAAAGLGGTALYLEWRGGGPDGAVSRQRIWVFEEDSKCNVSMRFYSLRASRPAGTPPTSLSFADLIGYPEACAMIWRRQGKSWIGRIDPARCRIVAQSGRGMRLDVTITADRRGFRYQEAGILDSGTKAFAVPPTMPYRFDRIAPPALPSR